MFFKKNVPGVERAIRIAIGLCMICVGVLFAPQDWMIWASVAAGAMAICTGFIGFCPMCAIAGRKYCKI